MKDFINEINVNDILFGDFAALYEVTKKAREEKLAKELEEDRKITEQLLAELAEIEALQAAKEVEEEVISNEVEEDIVVDFIDDLNDFVKEETKKQRAKKNVKFEIPSYFIKAKDEPVIKNVDMDLDSDGQSLKKWILKKVKKEQVLIKNEYMDHAIKIGISKTKAEKLLKKITENLGLTKCWVTNFSARQYPALKRTYSNAVYYVIN